MLERHSYAIGTQYRTTNPDVHAISCVNSAAELKITMAPSLRLFARRGGSQEHTDRVSSYVDVRNKHSNKFQSCQYAL